MILITDYQQYYAFLDEFMNAVHAKFPKCLIQFEDFSNNHTFPLLKKYRHKMLCFNDDIQGTGAVAAAGFANAVKLNGVPMAEQKVVFFVAGATGVSVADSIARMMTDYGLTHEQAMDRF